MNFKKWMIGAAVSLFFSLLVAGAGLAAGMTWRGFLAVFCTAAVTHFGAWMKQHPVENIITGDTHISRRDGGFISRRLLAILAWIGLVAFLVLAGIPGCASFSTTQTDERINEQTGEKTKITTRAKSRTFFDSKSQLANFKASQTEKSQSASVGSLSQEASGTNAVNMVEAAVGAAVRAASGR